MEEGEEGEEGGWRTSKDCGLRGAGLNARPFELAPFELPHFKTRPFELPPGAPGNPMNLCSPATPPALPPSRASVASASSPRRKEWSAGKRWKTSGPVIDRFPRRPSAVTVGEAAAGPSVVFLNPSMRVMSAVRQSVALLRTSHQRQPRARMETWGGEGRRENSEGGRIERVRRERI